MSFTGRAKEGAPQRRPFISYLGRGWISLPLVLSAFLSIQQMHVRCQNTPENRLCITIKLSIATQTLYGYEAWFHFKFGQKNIPDVIWETEKIRNYRR